MTSISLRRPDLTSRLPAIACPTVFVTGSDHPEWTPEQAKAKSRLLASGSVAVVPDTSYLTPLEAPDATIELIRTLWMAPSAMATLAPERVASAAGCARRPSCATYGPSDPTGTTQTPSGRR